MEGIWNRPECCNGNSPCRCPICLENKPLLRLNCGHFFCEDDIRRITRKARRLQVCPICNNLILNYGCYGININQERIELNKRREEEGLTDDEDDDDDYIGGKRKKRYTRNNKKRKSKKRKSKGKSKRNITKYRRR